LHRRHNDHAQKIDQAALVATNTDRALNKFLKDHQHQCEEDAQILVAMKQHMNEFVALLDETREAVYQQGLDLQVASANFQKPSPRLDNMGNSSGNFFGNQFSHLERQVAENLANLQRTTERVAKTDNCLTELSDEFAGNKLTTQCALQELRVMTTDNTNCISELSLALQRQGVVLKDTSWRADKVVRDQKRLHEQQSLTEDEVVGLVDRCKTTNEQLDGCKNEQQRTRADVLVLGHEANRGLSQLRGEIGATSTSLGRLSSRFEVCNQNVNGLGKGLQDVTKHTLLGEHNLISPRSVRQSRMSPIRAMTPRSRRMLAEG